MSKETYYSVKRDLLQCQRRPTTVSKETYYSVKRDLLALQTACSVERLKDTRAHTRAHTHGTHMRAHTHAHTHVHTHIHRAATRPVGVEHVGRN